MKNIEYQENIAAVEEMIKTITENTTEYLKQGIKLFEPNKFEEALKVFEALVLMDRSSASGYYYYGNTLFDFSEIEKSLNSIEKEAAYKGIRSSSSI